MAGSMVDAGRRGDGEVAESYMWTAGSGKRPQRPAPVTHILNKATRPNPFK